MVPLDPDLQRRSGGPTPGRLKGPDLALSGFQAAILLTLQKCSVLAFSDILKEMSEKREAAVFFRPAYCSNVFQMGCFLDVFFPCFPCFLVFSWIHSPHPVVLFCSGLEKVSFCSLSSQV